MNSIVDIINRYSSYCKNENYSLPRLYQSSLETSVFLPKLRASNEEKCSPSRNQLEAVVDRGGSVLRVCFAARNVDWNFNHLAGASVQYIT